VVDKWIPDFFWEEYNYFNRYFREMKKDFETIKDISAIGQKEHVNLEDIYVSLKLSEMVHERDLAIERAEIEDKIFDEKFMEKRKEKEVKRERIIDPEKALKQFHRMVIVGAPGSGKTTLLKHLALKYCQENVQKQERITVPIAHYPAGIFPGW
jgi:predicted NACHT family NTPase